MTRLYSNNFSTTLNGAITDVATSMTLTSVTGFPAVGSGDTAQVTLTDGTNIEVVTATAIAGSVITITRAQEGTSGTAFADADTVEIRITALSHTDVLSADLTPSIAGPLDVSGDYVGFGGSSTSTAYCLTHTANVPKLVGAANYYWGFSGSKLYAQAGTTWNSITFANDSTRLAIKTNNSERLSVNDSGTQFGATGARITHTIDDDTMATASATTLATSESIKAYADSVGGGAPEGTAVLSTGEVGGTKYLREDGDGTCSWQAVAGGGGDVVDDTTPQLGGDLDVNGNQIVSVSAGDIELHSDNDVNIILGDAAGADDFNIKDSASAIVASINSDGAADFTSLTLDTALAIAEGGTGVTAIPVMQAARSANQVITTATFTKAQYDTENLDTNGDYDNTTNYRFTPSVAGAYYVLASMVYDVSGDQMVMIAGIYKNGSAIAYNAAGASGTGQNGVTVGTAVAMNGSTDYLEVFVYQASGSNRNLNTNSTFAVTWVGES